MMADSTQHIALVALQICTSVLMDQMTPVEPLSEAALGDLYRFSTFHSITALVSEGLERLGYDKAQISAFCSAKDKAVRKNLMLDTERTRLFDYLEENGIWYMPLKGVVLKDMYPKMGLRQMSDNDILFDIAHRKTVRKWFTAHGYETKLYGRATHDSYRKEPVYYYEMHVALFREQYNAVWHAYYNTVRERLVKDEDKNYGYHFTVEDFYIYFLCHAFKHFSGNGIGLRFLFDMYVYLYAKQAEMDVTYIDKTLQMLGLVDFERDCRELVSCIFCDAGTFCFEQLTQAQQDLLTCFLNSGTYGTFQARAEKEIRKSGKFKYLLKMMFPGTDVLMQHNYPRIFRYKILLPVAWFYRAVKVVFTRPARIKKIWSTIVKN